MCTGVQKSGTKWLRALGRLPPDLAVAIQCYRQTYAMLTVCSIASKIVQSKVGSHSIDFCYIQGADMFGMYRPLGCLAFTLQLVSDPVAREKLAFDSIVLHTVLGPNSRATHLCLIFYMRISKELRFVKTRK